MPAVLFTIELPDGLTKECYSPSTVVRNYFTIGEEMDVSEFRERSRRALAEASERVLAKFGFSCSSAASQLEDIELFTRHYAPDGIVRILHV